MPIRRFSLVAGVLLVTLAQAANAQQAAPPPDSARVQIRAVLRAFYFYLAHQNWEALSTYVLSPKLLECRGGPSDLEMVTRRPGPRPRIGARGPGVRGMPFAHLAPGRGGRHSFGRGLGRGVGVAV